MKNPQMSRTAAVRIDFFIMCRYMFFKDIHFRSHGFAHLYHMLSIVIQVGMF